MNAIFRFFSGRTVLLDAVENLNGADTLSEVHFLVNEKGAKATITDGKGCSPLHTLAMAGLSTNIKLIHFDCFPSLSDLLIFLCMQF